MDICFRDVAESDFEWLYDLRKKTMSQYINESGSEFVRESQIDRIRKEYDSIKIVRFENQDVGMLKVVRHADRWEIIQIQLLPNYQCLGIGTQLIQTVLQEASIKKIPVYLSVLKVNPAKCLYEKLGFEIVEEKEISYTMCYCA